MKDQTLRLCKSLPYKRGRHPLPRIDRAFGPILTLLQKLVM